MLKKIKLFLKKILPNGQKGICLKEQNRTDNIYLTSFPKSGNTWVAFMVANTIKEHLKINVNINFFNIHSFIPEDGDYLTPNLEFFPFRKIIKNHRSFKYKYKYVFLLIRDPRDVMISYYYFMKNSQKYAGDLSYFIRDEKHGIQSWVSHTNSWLDNSYPSQRLFLFFYEDFKINSKKELKRMFNLMGFEIEDELLKKSIEKSSLENIKKLEKENMNYLKQKNKVFKFVRKGEITKGKELTQDDLDFILDKAKGTMDKIEEFRKNKDY
jgi:hypothetical protein